MPNIFINNKNLGPVIDVKELPTTDINPNALYRLISSKYDMVNGHGKDNEAYPVGFYKPATGTKWTASSVIYNGGSYSVSMDGYSASPCTNMRKGSYRDIYPVACTAAEASAIWYYDYARDNVYLAWNPVDYNGVNFYSPEKLDNLLGVNYLGVYVYTYGVWEEIGHEEECTFLGVIDPNIGNLQNVYVTKVGEKTYHIAGTFTLNKTLNVDGHRIFTNFAVGPTAKYAVCQQSGSSNMNPWSIPGSFMVMPDGQMWLRPASAMERVGGEVSFTITMRVA